MWEELLSTIGDRDYPLESMQEYLAGHVDPDKGWDLSLINPWFVERGYEFVGLLDLFSENEPSGIYVDVDGYVWLVHDLTMDEYYGGIYTDSKEDAIKYYIEDYM